jgi:TrmH family RNA methyltransferase
VKLLTLARDLKRRKARERTGLFVAEGVRTVEALCDSDLSLRGVLLAEGAAAEVNEAARELYKQSEMLRGVVDDFLHRVRKVV